MCAIVFLTSLNSFIEYRGHEKGTFNRVSRRLAKVFFFIDKKFKSCKFFFRTVTHPSVLFLVCLLNWPLSSFFSAAFEVDAYPGSLYCCCSLLNLDLLSGSSRGKIFNNEYENFFYKLRQISFKGMDLSKN